ncbi:MAG: hypothetical protein IPJ54_10215 [Saprospiraceae bacterium]|nr:hypothetical protein [Saprospiraceae bacterium]
MVGKTERFTASYKDVSLLKREALELGIMHIAIDIKWDKTSEITKTIYDKMVALRLEKLGNEWKRYYLFNKTQNTIDTL